MKTILYVFGLALSWIGCSSREQPLEIKEETLSLFNKSQGVFLPEEMKKRFGVELTEVVETNMSIRLTKSAQIYRNASAHSPAVVSALLSSAEARFIKGEQEVELEWGAKKMVGKVSKIDSTSEIQLGQIEILIEFSDPEKHLSVGNFVTARFVLPQTGSIVVIPKNALLPTADGDSVYVVNGEHFTRTKVKTGAESGQVVQIIDGLYSGDEVVSHAAGDLWLLELQATKTGQACCAIPKK